MPAALKELVVECWAPAMDDRPDFAAITRRLEHIDKGMPEVRGRPRLRRTCGPIVWAFFAVCAKKTQQAAEPTSIVQWR